MKSLLRLSLLLVIMHSQIQGVRSDRVLRLLSTPASWSGANDLCKVAGGQLARVSKSDLSTLKDCPELMEETGSYWAAGYNFLTPWLELIGCFQVTTGSVFSDVSDFDECYQICKQSVNFGLQEGGKCICLDSTDSLTFTASQSCLPCQGGSQYSCGSPNHIALYRPYTYDLDTRFCELEKNETCDCGVFQCEPSPVLPENSTWTYFSRNCSSKLQASCSDGTFTDENLAWVDSRQACITKGSYMSGPNILDWCSTSNVTLRKPYWGHFHRDRTTLYADTTNVSDSDISRIRECQYFSVIDDDVKLISTPACSETKGYLCSFDSDQGDVNDCLVRTTTTTSTTTTTTTTTPSPTTTTTTTTTTTPAPTTMTTTTTPVPTTTTMSPTTRSSSTTPMTTTSSGSVGAIKDGVTLTDEQRTGVIAGCVIGVGILIIIIMVACNWRKKVKEPKDTSNIEKGRSYFQTGSVKYENGHFENQSDIKRQPSSYPYKATSSFAAPVTESLEYPDRDEQTEGTSDETAIPSPDEDDKAIVNTLHLKQEYKEDDSPPTPCVPTENRDLSPYPGNVNDYITPSQDAPPQDPSPVHSVALEPNYMYEDGSQQGMTPDDSEFDDGDDDGEFGIPFSNPETGPEMEEPDINADNEPVSEPVNTNEEQPASVPENIIPHEDEPVVSKRPAYVSFIQVVATATEDTVL
ncbi:mucin-5AC-like [Ylistrum balloti]|uniref:mucin-5AC-like n=1 Tax=Ylistrum balloti TaxID=509963 RepID=UPI002905E155|nr:mucin-5AC-like [Ylistrum balloti]